MELVNKYYATVFSLNDSPAERKEAMQTFSVEHGAKCVENVEKMISMYGSNGHAVGDSLTWADILIYELTLALFEKVASHHEKFPHITEVHKNVAQHEKIAEYIKNRPEASF